jgi:uncharacterized surface protein with fasciclin (FAS1) repeats
MKNLIFHKIKSSGRLILFVLLLFSCATEPDAWKKKSTDLVMADYVAVTPGFTEFNSLLVSTGLSNLLSVRGPFTLLLPTDEAMQAYYAELNISSSLEMTEADKLKLIYNHLIANEIQSGDIGLGAIRDTNALGDYLVTEFQGADILVNKSAKIIKRDVHVSNGYIHVIDKVIKPVTISIFDLVASNPSFSIFAEGLRRTGLKDTLQSLSFPYGHKIARTRFTVLAVPDSVFVRNGINNIDECIARFTNRPDSVTYLQNPFYRYMEYHCLGGTYYLSDFTSRLYPILSTDNLISVVVDKTDYKMNIDNATQSYTGFYVPNSNYPAKNGALHTINNLLPVIEPAPTVITFETTDYFDMRQGDYYGKYYKKWFDGQNTFANIKWEGDYLLYYYKNHDTGTLLNWDCLSMNGFWWVEITTPKIMKGHYTLSGNIWSGQNNYAVYVDGVKTALVKITDASNPPLGEFTWTKTEVHKIKLVALSYGMLFWDTVVFSPVK